MHRQSLCGKLLHDALKAVAHAAVDVIGFILIQIAACALRQLRTKDEQLLLHDAIQERVV